MIGHYPISVDASGENPSFSLVLDGDDGQPYKKTYVFNGYRVNLVNTERYCRGTRISWLPTPSRKTRTRRQAPGTQE